MSGTEEQKENGRSFREGTQRFFLPPESFTDGGAHCEDTALVHQLTHVLRLSVGNQVHLLDGRGNLFQASVDKLTRNRVDFTLIKQLKTAAELEERSAHSLKIISLLPLIKGPRLEWALEKLTEVGVDVIQPFVSRRTVVKLKDKIQDTKKRWQHIVQEAAEQCERLTLPTILPPLDLGVFLEKEQKTAEQCLTGERVEETRIHLSERSKAPDMVSYLYNLPSEETSVVKILSGPEGGFCDEEKEALTAAGYKGVSLGANILRAETAAIVGAALANNLLRSQY